MFLSPFLVALSLSAAPAAAPPPAERFVIADVARLRSKPEGSAPVVGHLRINARVRLPAEPPQGQWTRVEVQQPALTGWVSAEALGEAEVTPAEARARLTQALEAADKASALAWADRLRALSPGEEKDLRAARAAYERLGDKARLKAVTQTLEGTLPIYLAACVPGDNGLERAVLAEFRPGVGFRRIDKPGPLAGWIGAAAWHAAADGDVARPVRVSPVPSRRPGPPPPPPETEEDAEWYMSPPFSLDRVVLEPGCGSLAPAGLLATWPFRRVLPAAAPETQPVSPDAGLGDPGMGDLRVHRERMELTYGGRTHLLQLEVATQGVTHCHTVHEVRFTDLSGEKAPVLDIELFRQQEC